MAWTATPQGRRAKIIIPTVLLGNQGGNEMIGSEDTWPADNPWLHDVSSALCFLSYTHPLSFLHLISTTQPEKGTNTNEKRSKVTPSWSPLSKIFLETVS